MDFVLSYALSLLGTPYKWGGNNPMEGLDCSGLVQCILNSAGLDPAGRQTAQDLYNHFESKCPQNIYVLGSLAFFGESVTKITHVAFILSPYQMLEASGGDHLTLNRDDASKKNAYAKVTLIKHRSDLVAVLKPSYASIGCP